MRLPIFLKMSKYKINKSRLHGIQHVIYNRNKAILMIRGNNMKLFIEIIEIIGTVAFSVSGAMIGIKKDMDIFGITFLGIVTAVGGGILRDLMIGITPPQCFQNSQYIIVAFISALVFFFPFVRKSLLKSRKTFDFALLLMDSIGLAVFTAVGITTALKVSDNFNPVLLVCVGLLTGTGGGVLRDILAHDIPYIFVKHVYATASIIGGIVYLIIYNISVQEAAISVCIISVFAVRCLSAYFKWNLPKARV